MIGIIKDRRSFVTKRTVQITAYDAVLDSIYNSTSSFTLAGSIELTAGDFLLMGSHIWVIGSFSPGQGKTDVTCEGIFSLFSRELPAITEPGTSIESFLAGVIHEHFTAQPDEAYRIPFLRTEILTEPGFLTPLLEQDGLWSVRSYIAYVRRLRNVFTEVRVTKDTLVLTIRRRVPEGHSVFMGHIGYELISENYSSSSVAKITVLSDGTAADYYLLADGTVSTSPSGERAEGTWETMTVSNPEDALSTVENAFAANSKSHSIEFYGTRKIPFYDRVKIRLKDRVLESYISQVSIQSGDTRWRYKSGELKVTFTEKQKEVI